MTREEAETLIGTLIACVNEAHAAVSYEWRDSCLKAADAAGERVVLALTGAQNAPNFADAYQGAMEEVAIWKKRALEAEDLNRKFIAEINGPTHMGEHAQPAPSEPSDEYVGWYCAHCERGVDASEVTYHEQHQACGRVITDDRPPRHSPSVPDSIIADAARYQFLRNGGAYLEPNEGEIYMATDYGAKYYKDLRDLDMDIDEAIAAAPEAKP